MPHPRPDLHTAIHFDVDDVGVKRIILVGVRHKIQFPPTVEDLLCLIRLFDRNPFDIPHIVRHLHIRELLPKDEHVAQPFIVPEEGRNGIAHLQ